MINIWFEYFVILFNKTIECLNHKICLMQFWLMLGHQNMSAIENAIVCVFAPCCVHVFALLIVMSQASFLKSKKIPPLSDLLSLINMKDLVNRHVQECREYKKFNPKLYLKPLSPSKNHTLYLHLLSNVHSLLVLSLGLPLFLSDIFYWIPM